MRYVNRFSLLLPTIVISACTGEQEPPPTVVSTDAEQFVHSSSGCRFPGTIVGFQRTHVKQFDAVGADISVGYNKRDDRIIATVFIYPVDSLNAGEDRPVDHHFQQLKSAVMRMYPEGSLLFEDDLRVAGRAGKRATFAIKRAFVRSGNSEEAQSEVYLFACGKWYVEYRISYPRAFAKEATSAVAELISALGWPVNGQADR